MGQIITAADLGRGDESCDETKERLCSKAKVCSALRYRNIDPLGRRHEYTGGFVTGVLWC